MKKLFLLIAATALLSATCVAQSNARRVPANKMARMHTEKLDHQWGVTHGTATSIKTAGDTVSTFPWMEQFEYGTTPAGFTLIDNDGDGYNWDPSFLYSNGGTYGHNGSQGMIASASYDNNVGALTPDNWMILPTMVIPANATDLELSWYEKGQDANYAAEFYSVYIATGARTVSTFTATTPVLTSTTGDDWVKKTVSLSSYAGQTINIAFRHHNISDMYYLDIDDIRIGTAGAPELSLVGPTVLRAGDTAVYEAEVSGANTVTWGTDADYIYADGNQLTVAWENGGTYYVAASATNNVGTVSDTLVVTVMDCAPITTFPFAEGFENDIPCWKTVLADPNNSNEFGVVMTDNAMNGDGAFVFSSYDEATDYNQYLITPEITLPNDGFMVKFYYFATSESESFRVMVSSTDDNLSSFTTILGSYETTVSGEYQEVAYALPANTKFVAINYYGDYVYDLYIDDLSIEEVTAPHVVLNGPESIGTGNEATFVATSPLAESFAWTVDGAAMQEAGNILTYVFTTVGNHTVTVTGTNEVGTSDPVSLTVNVFDCSNITLPYAPEFTQGLRCWTSRSDETEDMGWFASVDMFESDPVGQVLSMSAENVFGMFMFDVPVDNWLISPNLTMPSNGSYEIAWKVMPFSTDYAGDHYAVYVIDNNDNPTMLYEQTLNSSINSFEQHAVTIPANVSGDFRVAFRHFDSEGGYVIILDDIEIVTAGTTGIDNIEDNSVVVYPNPATNMLNVDGEGIVSMQMLDMNGRTVMERNHGGAIDISNLANGMYIVRIVSNDGVSIRKVVKK